MKIAKLSRRVGTVPAYIRVPPMGAIDIQYEEAILLQEIRDSMESRDQNVEISIPTSIYVLLGMILLVIACILALMLWRVFRRPSLLRAQKMKVSDISLDIFQR